ncbi:nucleoside/nucleotide kinase family protein [Curtobacterium sp. MCJR17_055]|nr:nucleoside/nucleotide kinase family protein [Curtobacterium sp. MCBD17_029]PYY39721.1 nucleoside/nucleotide kinase family protein [Curtobacterium sp. MCPF17_046]PYY56966.1 nucleoside/nucleotide kinase family protein [Curtobacterium sp. MCJR17_055]PYY62119.1 nucleoside/nucleotide kinase family protein [Curtobacterium sp. MCPF17_015]
MHEDGPVRTQETLSVDQAVARAVALAEAGGRSVVGIAGAPGAGKSTLARRVVTEVVTRLGPGVAVQVPMDGFHLANAALDTLGRRGRKGAVDTFDAAGYVALVRRLTATGGTDGTVWAPDFDRRVDEPVAGSIAVPPETVLVVSEGNYLLDQTAPWRELPDLFTETWACVVDDSVRIDRLVGRHMRHGRDHEAARRWAVEVDGVNAERVTADLHRASVLVRT